MNLIESASTALVLELLAPVANGNDESALFNAKKLDRARGFVIDLDGDQEIDRGESLLCGDVQGFREASVAAVEPRAMAPQRLVIIAPEPPMTDWLAEWAEDSERVRRTISIGRRFDGREITIVATLASYGYGVETSLLVESIRAKSEELEIFRSGVHSIAEVEAALGAGEVDALGNHGEGVDRTE